MILSKRGFERGECRLEGKPVTQPHSLFPEEAHFLDSAAVALGLDLSKVASGSWESVRQCSRLSVFYRSYVISAFAVIYLIVFCFYFIKKEKLVQW